MEKLTHQEEEAMRYIWKIGMCCVKDILKCYPEPGLPYTTLASIVNNLKRKGYVTARRFGNTYIFQPAVTKEEYAKTSVGTFVKNYFADSYKDMVSFFAREQKISKEDLEDILNLIENKEGE